MSYSVKNKTGQQIVCNLKDGSTFRISAGETKYVTKENATKYLFNRAKAGDFVIREVKKEEKSKKVVTLNKSTTKKKKK